MFVCLGKSLIISSPAEEMVLPDHPTDRSQVLDHLGLVAGMFDACSIGDIIDPATQQNPARRDLTVGAAVNAMGLNGRGFINQALYRVPRFFQTKPPYRLISLRVVPAQLNAAALGRALDTLDDYGVTELCRLIAATAATRLGLSPPYPHLDSPSFHGDGRYHSDEPPAEPVVPLTKGSRRDHRPALNQVMGALIVEHQAGLPVLMKPLSGHRSDPHAWGQVLHASIDQLPTTDGAPSLVADRVLDSEDNLDKLAHTASQWSTRGPATVRDAQVALAQADPLARAALQEGSRYHEVTSTHGGVEQRGILLDSAPRQPQAPRTVDKQRHQASAKEVKAFKPLCRTTLACEADARPALSAFEQALPATVLDTSPGRATPR